MKGLMDACQEAAGTPGRVVWTPVDVLTRHGASPEDESKEHLPLFTPGHALGQVSIARALGDGLALRPTVATARETLAWWRAAPAERRARMRGGLTPEVERAILAEMAGRAGPSGIGRRASRRRNRGAG
jgi:2'-hydroxyisoflavone reductase